jgi:hypothetical protein
MALPKPIDKYWQQVSDLTIHDAAFWMHFGYDPREHKHQYDADQNYADHFEDHPNAAEALYENGEVLISAIREGVIKTTIVVKKSGFEDITKTKILKTDWLRWCQENEYIELSQLFSKLNSTNPTTDPLHTLKPSELDTPIANYKGNTPKPIFHKLNRNSLDPAIDEAIKQAGNLELADVYLKLKLLAISEHPPFTGEIEGKALCYTNDSDKTDKLTKDALGKRLKTRRDNAE